MKIRIEFKKLKILILQSMERNEFFDKPWKKARLKSLVNRNPEAAISWALC
jgi:hypothetical protein